MYFGSNYLMMKVRRTHPSSMHCRILWRLSYGMLCIMGLSKFRMPDYLSNFTEEGKRKKLILFFYNRMSFHDSFLLCLWVSLFLCRILETTHLHALRNQNDNREQRFEKIHFHLTQKKAWREKVFCTQLCFSK